MMELPKQYTTSKGKPNILGLTLFLLSITALSFQIYTNRMAIKRHKEGDEKEKSAELSLANRVSELETKVAELSK